MAKSSSCSQLLGLPPGFDCEIFVDTDQSLAFPYHLDFDSHGNLYISNGNPFAPIVKVAPDGSVTFSPSRDLYISEFAAPGRIFRIFSTLIPATIDIKPGSFPNSINLKSKGVIPVAILTTDDFDATIVDPLSVLFGPNGATESHGKGHIEDVDGDGDLDMVLHFNTLETGIQCGDTSASLSGITTGGQSFEGSDSIKTVGCK